MKVIATKPGYLGKLRLPGDEFDVPEGTKGSWFKPVEQKAEDKKSKSKPADEQV